MRGSSEVPGARFQGHHTQYRGSRDTIRNTVELWSNSLVSEPRRVRHVFWHGGARRRSPTSAVRLGEWRACREFKAVRLETLLRLGEYDASSSQRSSERRSSEARSIDRKQRWVPAE
jgi:hypothetical protein